MSFHVGLVFYFAASAIILNQNAIESVNGQCTTEGCGHDDLSMTIITEIQQQIVQALGPLNTQIQNIHDLLTSQHGSVMRSLHAVDRRLEEHHIYIKQGQNYHELLNKSFQQMKSHFDAVNASLQTVDRNFENYHIDMKNQTEKSRKLFNDTCDPELYGTTLRDCSDIKACGYTANGVYEVCAGHQPNRLCANAYCDMKNGTSLVFQRRKDGNVNFNRTWAEYREGFGNPDGEFWLGNEMLYLLASKRNYKLRVNLEDFNGTKRYAEYATFSINSSTNNYRLTVSGYSGNAGDSLIYHNSQQFSTKDAGHDEDCAKGNGGGWWFKGFFQSALNGIYRHQSHTPDPCIGIKWRHWRNDWYSLKTTEMKLVPVV